MGVPLPANLFAGRDKTVQLQFVLLEPDAIAGAPSRSVVPASVARPWGEFEATALPQSPEEWLKFDAIVLGDLGPETLDEAAVATLRRFVGDAGGTLVVIAGPENMPQRFAGSDFLDLLPAKFPPGAAARRAGVPLESHARRARARHHEAARYRRRQRGRVG